MRVNFEGPFILNDQTYTKEELLFAGEAICKSAGESRWKKDIFNFISGLLNPEIPLLHKSSGTTGEPKTFSLKREAMIRSSRSTLAHFGIPKGASVLLCLPVEYIAGKMMVVRALTGGLNLIITEPSGRPINHIRRPIDFGAMVPLQLHETLVNNDPLHLLGTLLIGGGEIHQDLRKRIEGLKNTEVHETFGMSETYTHFASRRINGDHPESYFNALPGVTISVDNRGCLVAELPGITDEPVVTNDLVRLRDDTRFEWLGRIDNVINSGGIKIFPETLELKMQGILHCELGLCAIPDQKLGEKLVLVIKEEAETPSEKHIMNILRAELEKHEIPGHIVCHPELPRNKSMKVDRVKLKDMVNSKI